MKTPVLRVRVTCVRARKSSGKMEVERQTMLHQSVKVVLGELYQKKVTLIGLDKHYAFYCCSQTYLIAKISIY